MITYDEAIMELLAMQPKDGAFSERTAEAIATAMVAIERKKLKKIARLNGYGYCPECQDEIRYEGYITSYCPRCGQHLIWEE